MKNKKLASALAFNMPKIDSSVSLMFEQQEKLASTLAFNMPKINSSILENFYTDEKIAMFQDDIRILNIKIESKTHFTSNDWKIYFNIIKEVFYMLVALLSIHTFFFPDNIEMRKLQNEFKILSKNIVIDTNYEVVRTVNIRDYPNSSKKTKILDVVYPKQKLLLLDRKSKWIEIEYFSEKKQETITGWIYKKYTKRI